MKCKNTTMCIVHEGRKFFKKIRTFLSKLNPNHEGWKKVIQWNTNIKGSLNTLINFKHLRKEFLKTKQMINDFNKSRTSLREIKKDLDFYTNKKSNKRKYTIQKRKSQEYQQEVPNIKNQP